MPKENNKKNQKEMPLYILFGDRDQYATREAIRILDEAEIKYSFVPADPLSESLPHLSSGLSSYIRLYQIACLCARAKHRRSLEKLA